MKYINTFKTHASYEEKLNVGGVDFKIPNVSYCKDVNDVHFNPYNLIKFYVGEITTETSQTVSIYTDETNHLDVTVNEGKKWYTYVLPKVKGLCKIEGDSVKNVVIKANMANYNVDNSGGLFPSSIIEASFKGSNTSNVTYMNYMFEGCQNLTSLDVSNFDTSKVTTMDSMFQDCTSLTSLDVSNFDTSNVTNMASMFSSCSGLASLDLSNFNTSNVTNMHHMFSSCPGITSLDLSNFDTSKVTYMHNMFYGCSRLTSLDLSKWDTSNVTDMYQMFYGCSGLKLLDLSDWNTSKVNYTTDMFKGCTSLTTIRMKGCSEATRTKVQNQLIADGITRVEIIQ